MRYALAGLDADVVARLRPFLEDLPELPGVFPLAVLLYGSAVTPDYLAGKSDVNLLLFHEKPPDMECMDALFRLAWRHRPRRIATPLMMTPRYLNGAMDATPIEILDLKLHHRRLWGEDFLESVKVTHRHLRLDCEHQLRRLYLHLQRGYVRVGGDPTELRELLRVSLVGYLAVFRALLLMLGGRLPAARDETIVELGRRLTLEVRPVQEVARVRRQGLRMDVDELKRIYLGFHTFVGDLMYRVDAMSEA